jgi:hypothetical protein
MTAIGWGQIDTDYPVGEWADAVKHILSELVPMLIADFKGKPNTELESLGREAVKVTTPLSEPFMFHDGRDEQIAAGGNAIAVQLACLAILSPTGITFQGMHFCLPYLCDRCGSPEARLISSIEGS